MGTKKKSATWRNGTIYDVDVRIAEIYDQTETSGDDVALIQTLIDGRGPLRILEPFCGTGRILLPLSIAGHEVVGLDQSAAMLDRAKSKLEELSTEVQQRVTLIEADVTRHPWPTGFDLVILGGNCLYELATPKEQSGCIASAADAVNPGGYVYIDNDHMEGELDASWRQPGMRDGFPSGVCSDGTRVEGGIETTWYEESTRLVRFRRHVKLTQPDGAVIERECIQQKHPVSTAEVESWLTARGFIVEQLYGDRMGTSYTDLSERAIFWARRR